MPARNSRKQYIENGCYHLYNRGVEKRRIFQDEMDYSVFLSYLKDYLLFKDVKELTRALVDLNRSTKEKDRILKLLRLNNFNKEIELLCYCLMPNHFHFEIQQISAYKIDSFMNSLCTRYTMYFNRKYKRVGPLFEGVYKAVLVSSDEQLLELSRYIHRQAINENQPSSYLDYVGQRKTTWLNPEHILIFFSKSTPQLSYAHFLDAEENFELIHNLLIED